MAMLFDSAIRVVIHSPPIEKFSKSLCLQIINTFLFVKKCVVTISNGVL